METRRHTADTRTEREKQAGKHWRNLNWWKLREEARHTEMNPSNTWSLNSDPSSSSNKTKTSPMTELLSYTQSNKNISHLDDVKHVHRMFFSIDGLDHAAQPSDCPTVNHRSKLEAGHIMFIHQVHFLYWYFISGIEVVFHGPPACLYCWRTACSSLFCICSLLENLPCLKMVLNT